MKQAILYLFIVLLISCSSDNPGTFKAYLEQSENSIKLIEIKNDYYFKKMEDSYNESKARTKSRFMQSMAIKNKADTIKHKIDYLIEQFELGSSIKHISNKKEINVLKKEISSLNKFYLSIIDEPKKNEGLVHGLNERFSTGYWETFDTIFSGELQMTEYITGLLKLKLDLIINQHFMYQYLYQYIAWDASGNFSNTGVFVIPNAQTIRKGESVKAEILFASYDTNFTLKYAIDKKMYTGNNGEITFKSRTNKIGSVSKNGVFLVRDYKTGKDSLIPFTIQYEVLRN